MACITKRRNRWILDFYDQHGKRRWKTLPKGTTKKKAKDELRAIEDQVSKGVFLPTQKIPTFKEVCEATEGCETKGEKWEAWKAFFIAGFPAQKLLFLPKGASPDAVETYTKALQSILDRPDFAEISLNHLGKYPQMTGEAAQKALTSVFSVPEEAKAFVVSWLEERYGVKLE